MKINICLFLVSLFVSIQLKSAELTIRILNIEEKNWVYTFRYL